MDPTSSIRLCEVDSLYLFTQQVGLSPLLWVFLSAQVLQLSPRAPSDVPPPPPPPLSLPIRSFLQHNQRCLFIQHSFRGPANEKKICFGGLLLLSEFDKTVWIRLCVLHRKWKWHEKWQNLSTVVKGTSCFYCILQVAFAAFPEHTLSTDRFGWTSQRCWALPHY